MKCPNCLQGILRIDSSGNLVCNECTDWYKHIEGALTK